MVTEVHPIQMARIKTTEFELPDVESEHMSARQDGCEIEHCVSKLYVPKSFGTWKSYVAEKNSLSQI